MGIFSQALKRKKEKKEKSFKVVGAHLFKVGDNSSKVFSFFLSCAQFNHRSQAVVVDMRTYVAMV